MDPDGALVGAWTTLQPLDETARTGSLLRLLEPCRQHLSRYEANPKVVVLRDGRLFENENSILYSQALETDLSLLEYRKRDNPQIFISGRELVSPTAPFAATVPGNSTMFIVTAPSRNDHSLQTVAKVTWREEWNGLGFEPRQFAELLTTSSAAPGLGLHARHLPAAIYWADGIAGSSDRDLRFRGVPVRRE